MWNDGRKSLTIISNSLACQDGDAREGSRAAFPVPQRATQGILRWIFQLRVHDDRNDSSRHRMVATSKDARSYIAGYPAVKGVMTVAVIIFLVAEIVFSVGAVATSHDTKRLIERALKYAPDKTRLIEPSYYTPKIIPRHGVNIFVAVHAALYGVLIIIIWSISPAKRR